MENQNTEDYYAILGVSSTARLNEIKKAFRRLQRKVHPDISKTAATRDISAKLNESYQVLSSALNRLEYDLQNGFKDKTEENVCQLQEFKKRRAYKIRENMSASAQRSRDIESNVECHLSDGRIIKNCGLIITKAKYGLIDRERRSRAITSNEKAPILPRSLTINYTRNKRVLSNTGYVTNNIEYIIDVTDAVQCLITHRGQNGGYIEIEDKFDKSTLDGFYNPSPSIHINELRYLEIEYMFNRKYHYVKVNKFEYICIPNQSHIVHIFDANNEYNNNRDIVHLPSGKVAVQSRPSLVGLKKFSDIEKLRIDDNNIRNKMIKWSIGLMIIGAIGGFGYYLVDKAQRDANNNDNNKGVIGYEWKEYVVLYIQRYWNWLIGKKFNHFDETDNKRNNTD